MFCRKRLWYNVSLVHAELASSTVSFASNEALVATAAFGPQAGGRYAVRRKTPLFLARHDPKYDLVLPALFLQSSLVALAWLPLFRCTADLAIALAWLLICSALDASMVDTNGKHSGDCF